MNQLSLKAKPNPNLIQILIGIDICLAKPNPNHKLNLAKPIKNRIGFGFGSDWNHPKF